jgi:predicted O-methyltransferase YrrM
MSTREFKTTFLDKLREPIDMAFIDADHTSTVAFQDFEDLFPHLIESGIIFMHDTYPCDKKFLISEYCGDAWRVPDMIKAKYGRECEVLTIPIQPGLTMVRKVTRRPVYMR